MTIESAAPTTAKGNILIVDDHLYYTRVQNAITRYNQRIMSFL
jgi:hypothetical protein